MKIELQEITVLNLGIKVVEHLQKIVKCCVWTIIEENRANNEKKESEGAIR